MTNVPMPAEHMNVNLENVNVRRRAEEGSLRHPSRSALLTLGPWRALGVQAFWPYNFEISNGGKIFLVLTLFSL